MPHIRQLTFSASDMREYAMKSLLSCKEYIEEYNESNRTADLIQAARHFGKAVVWLDWLSDIGIEYAAEDQDVDDLLGIAERAGLEY